MGKYNGWNRYNNRNRFQQKVNNMNTEEEKDINGAEMEDDSVFVDDVNPTPEEGEMAQEEIADADVDLSEKVKELEGEVEKEKKEYLFLMAEFDNFRKRTLKEKSELIKNAAESVFKGLLPIVDDFERAIKASENSEDANTLKEGMELIYKKLKKYMEQNGVKEMDPEDRDFDADKHEAISAVPVPDEAQKGKILDTVEKGYTINDKVLRHAKVVVGQ